MSPHRRGICLCDGSAIDQTAHPRLYALFSHVGAPNTGKLPDLTDQFIRGASASSDCTGHIEHNDTTRLPRQHNFSGTTSSDGHHRHYANRGGGSADAGWLQGNAYLLSDQYAGGTHEHGTSTIYTNYENAHHHTVSMTQGGDTETAPKHVRLAYCIKHD